MTKGIFIAGTDTDVGKTYITAQLVKKMRQDGIDCGYYKAVLSGACRRAGQLIPGDAEYVCKTAGIPMEPGKLVSYMFEEAVSPHLAAQRAAVSINLHKIREDYHKIAQKFDFVAAEGSGGIVCPIQLGENQIMLTDIIKALNLEIILVSHSGLGSINACVLTTAYAKSAGLTVKGIILNRYEEDNFMHRDNRKTIEALTGIKVVAMVKEEQ